MQSQLVLTLIGKDRPGLVDALASAVADHGFLWRVSKDGRSSWLYGTLHVA